MAAHIKKMQLAEEDDRLLSVAVYASDRKKAMI